MNRRAMVGLFAALLAVVCTAAPGRADPEEDAIAAYFDAVIARIGDGGSVMGAVDYAEWAFNAIPPAADYAKGGKYDVQARYDKNPTVIDSWLTTQEKADLQAALKTVADEMALGDFYYGKGDYYVGLGDAARTTGNTKFDLPDYFAAKSYYETAKDFYGWAYATGYYYDAYVSYSTVYPAGVAADYLLKISGN